METDSKTVQGQAQQALELDKAKLDRYLQQLRDNQNLVIGLLGGVVAATVGAVLWAVITAVTNYQIGWMAVGVGFLVGLAVRVCGNGVDTSFGVMGAALSLLGYLAGNLLAVCVVVARQEGMPLLELLSRLNPQIALGLLTATFSPMDLVFYGLAIYEGYQFSLRRLKPDELAKLVK